jgi:acyl carrier protein
MEAIEPALQNIFRKVLKHPNLELRPEMTSNDVAGWNSLANVMLIIQIQKEFQIKIAAGEVVRLKNVGELIELVQAKRSGL